MQRIAGCLITGVVLATAASVALAGDPPAELVWQDRFDIGGDRDSVHQVAVSRGLVVAEGLSWLERRPGQARRDRVTHVSAYDLHDGDLVWRQQIDGSVGGQLLVNRGVVLLVGSRHFSAHTWAFDLVSGAELWQAQGPAVETEAPRAALSQGILYTAGAWRPTDAPQFALLVQARDLMSGVVLWEHRGTAGAPVVVSSVAVHDGRLAVLSIQRPGQDVGAVDAFDALTGSHIWQRTEDDTTLRLLNSAGALCGGRLFIGASRAARPFANAQTFVVQALDPETGDTLWERSFDGANGTSASIAGLLCSGRSVFAAAVSGSANDDEDDVLSLWAFSRRGGKTRWHHDFAADRIAGRLLQLEASGVLARVDDELRLYAPRSGKLLWQIDPFPGGDWTSSDLAHNGYLAVAAGIFEDDSKSDAVVRVLR